MKISEELKPIFDLYPILKKTVHVTPLNVCIEDGETEKAKERIRLFQRDLARKVKRNAKRSKQFNGTKKHKTRATRDATESEKKRYKQANSFLGRIRIDLRIKMIQYGLPSIKATHLSILGANIGNNVMITHGNTLDPIFPEKITIGDNTILGMGSCIFTHEILDGELRVGDVNIGENVLICSGALILPGITIGNNSIVSPGVLASDVDDNTFAIGLPESVRYPFSARHKMDEIKKRDLEKTPYTLYDWRKFRDPFIALINNILLEIQRSPKISMNIRKEILRLVGVKIGKGVIIEPNVNIDGWFPELIEIGDNSIIKKHSVIATHEGIVGGFRKGKVIIGDNVMISPGAGLLPGIEIHDNAEVLPYAFVASDINQGIQVEGIPARKIGEAFNLEEFTDQFFSYSRDVWDEMKKSQ
ncbi:MAG: acyltransferase [Candidatus Helarchaeota archaeon]